ILTPALRFLRFPLGRDSPHNHSMDPQAGHPATIGRLVVESVLGSGGRGTVYKAVDPTLKRTVAVKTVRPGLDNPELLDRLLREAQACARPHHTTTVTIYQ